MERDGQLVLSESPEAGIRVLRLSRSDKLNALTLPMVSELKRAFDDIAQDESCRVVILTGAGRGFCSGVDVGQTAERRKGGLEPSDKLRNQRFVVSSGACGPSRSRSSQRSTVRLSASAWRLF